MKNLTQFLIISGVLAQIGFGQSQLQPSDVSGVWEGTVRSFGQDSRLIYKISVNDDGTPSASHDSPDYGFNSIPVAEAKREADHLVMKIGLYPAVFEGTVGRNVIKGRYGTPGIEGGSCSHLSTHFHFVQKPE